MNSNNYDKEIVTVILFISFFMVIIAIIMILFFYFSRKKIVQKEVEKKELIVKHQKKLLSASIMTQEAERKRIAQDLHDDISSKLNVVSLNSHLLKTPQLSVQELSEITENIVTMTQKALESSRKIAHGLLPPVFEKFGLHAGIEELCDEFNSSKAVVITYANNVEFDEKEQDRHLHVFRVLQELMNNSIRHGKATEIDIKMNQLENEFYCLYRDNGVGFDSETSENQKGLGMKNIESRILFIDGSLKIDSKIGQGIQVQFTF